MAVSKQLRMCHLVVVFVFFGPVLVSCRYDFCKRMCWNGEMELGCKCKKSEYCQTLEQDDWEEFRESILFVHNEIRNCIASGQMRDVGFPPATNMAALSYDYELEYTARCHAKQCLREHHDCASTSKFDKTGQNIFTLFIPFQHSNRVIHLQDWKDRFNIDFDQETLAKIIDDFHYEYRVGISTQIIWAHTTHLGCWQVKGTIRKFLSSEDAIPIKLDSNKQFMLTCNYGPGGNFPGEKIYEKGPKASNCSGGTKSHERYPALCGEEILPEPPYPQREYGFDDPIDTASSTKTINRPIIVIIIVIVTLLQ